MGKRGYYSYIDKNGKKYEEGDIYFCDSELLASGRSVDTYPTIFSKGIKKNDKKYGFPLTISFDKNKRSEYKVNTNKEILPIHAGSIKQKRAICFACPSAGKSTFFLTSLMSANFRNLIARSNKIGIIDDISMRNNIQEEYIRNREDLENRRMLPENNVRGMQAEYSYFIKGNGRELLFTITDVSGEDCIELGWARNEIIMNDYFLVMIGADELLNQNVNMRSQYMIEGLVTQLNALRPDNDYEILLIITKADLINVRPRRRLGPNSIKCDENGKMRQVIHVNGFDEKIFEEREKNIKEFFKSRTSNVLECLKEKKVHYMAIASIGMEPDENNVFNMENYNPYSVDEPIMYILAKEKIAKTKYKDNVIEHGIEELNRMAQKIMEKL